MVSNQPRLDCAPVEITYYNY